jgi:hypothetical protein
MAITITQPTAGFRLGQGMVVFGTCAGPTLLDDEVLLNLAYFVTGEGGARGANALNGSTAWTCLLGYDAINKLFIGAQSGLADGHACVLDVTIRHHSGVVMEHDTFPFLWDAVSGIAGLLGMAGVNDPQLAAILSSVQRTFP